MVYGLARVIEDGSRFFVPMFQGRSERKGSSYDKRYSEVVFGREGIRFHRS